MVKKITAFQADDGSVHESELEAVLQDARLILKRTELFNPATIEGLLKMPHELAEALVPICALIPKAAKDA